MIGSIIFAAFSVIFCLLFCWFRSEKASISSLVLKTISSVCFILCGVFATKTVGGSSFNLLIIVGLIFGLIGDIILDLKIMYPEQSNQYFVVGTSAFAIGHFFYFLSAVLYNINMISSHLLWNILASVGVAILLTLAIIFSSKKMGLNFGKMFYIVVGYSVILTFMVSFSISIAIFCPMFWIFACGMILFFASDLVLSMQYFGGKDQKVWIWVNHVLYYLAQVMIALSILFLA